MSSATRPHVFLVPAQFTDRWMWTRLAPVADVEHVAPMRVELPAYEDGIRARIERASTARPVCVAGASLGAYVAARIAATTSAVAHLFAFSGLVRLPEEANTSRLETPATIVHGARDQAVAFALGEELAAAAPNGRFTALDTSSHLLSLTHDADVAEAMHATLARLTT